MSMFMVWGQIVIYFWKIIYENVWKMEKKRKPLRKKVKIVYYSRNSRCLGFVVHVIRMPYDLKATEHFGKVQTVLIREGARNKTKQNRKNNKTDNTITCLTERRPEKNHRRGARSQQKKTRKKEWIHKLLYMYQLCCFFSLRLVVRLATSLCRDESQYSSGSCMSASCIV